MSATVGFFPRDEYFMRLALREAERALDHDDVPIGAVIVHDGEVIATGRNERELRGDPTAHAELLAVREASAKAGAAGSVLNVLAEPRLNHRPVVAPGLLADESAALLRAFFASKR
jgi:tRNA(adenine34) deaminase